MKIPPRPLYIDSHCHLDDPRVDFEVAVQMAVACSVEGAVVPGYGPERWPRQSELVLAESAFRIWGALGVHPWTLEKSRPASFYVEELEQGFLRYASVWGKRLVAVGEFGLDRARSKDSTLLELQEAVFRSHLKLARQHQLPVILHLVRADGVAQRLLQELPPAQGVIHGFSSHPETVPAYAEMNLSFGFGAGLLHFPKVRQALKVTPPDRVMFETDDPIGPHSLEDILQTASQVLGKSVEYLRTLHGENCARVFRL